MIFTQILRRKQKKRQKIARYGVNITPGRFLELSPLWLFGVSSLLLRREYWWVFAV